jgi:hypothetical protein
VRKAIARLTGRPVPNTVQGYVDSYLPLFAQIAASCGAKNFRTVDQALFSYKWEGRSNTEDPMKRPYSDAYVLAFSQEHLWYEIWMSYGMIDALTHSRGCFVVRHTFFSFLAPRRWRIFEKISQRPNSICRTSCANA